jgi:hypothetical protein
MTRIFKKVFIFLVIPFIFLNSIHAENITDNDFGFSLDIPEGFNLDDYTEDGLSLLFSHPNNSVNLAVKIYVNQENQDSSSVLNTALSKLNADKDIDSFFWNETETAISSFSMNLDKNYKGWALCAQTNPKLYENSYIALICYCDSKLFDSNFQFIMSTLNSLCVDFEKYNTSGPVVSYAFPKEGEKRVTLNIDGLEINTSIDNCDIEASTFLVDLEYSVLCLYARHNLKNEAWQRFYRMIYRDGYSRLEQVSSDVYETLWPVARQKNQENPSLYYAQALLSWVQNFKYENAKSVEESDFTSLPAAICSKGNDCDSRSMLVATLLNSCGIESILLISSEYSHAMVASAIEAPGQVYYLNGTDRYFLFGETTAKITWGMIFQDFADQSKWIPVILP